MHKATTTPSPYYCATFNNPSLSMSIKLKDMSDKYQRFVDFQAGVMFPVQSDNSIKINSFQYEKIMDIISMELTKFVKDGFPTNSKPITENTFTIENNNNLIGEPTMGNTNNLPQVFTFESDKQIRTIKKDDDILFVAKDVADALEYTWAGIATIKHVPDIWRGVNSVLTPPKKVTPDFSISGIDPFEDWKVSQEMLCLTEQGLYFFINRSDKPKALPFQMWLAGEVLPSIRKTGSYSTNANDNLNNMNNAILEKMALLLEKMVEQSQPKRTRKAKEVPALKEHTLFENQEALHNQHLDLIEKAIALAADSGKPFTHKRLHGIYEKRNRLSKELQHLGRKPLESMTQQLLYSGRVVKCRLALGAGRKQWLDVPTGNFGQGNGVIHR